MTHPLQLLSTAVTQTADYQGETADMLCQSSNTIGDQSELASLTQTDTYCSSFKAECFTFTEPPSTNFYTQKRTKVGVF